MDPMIATCYPATVATELTLAKANKAARDSFEDEFGGREDAVIWNEIYQNGMIRIRAVYQDVANDAKAIAWVEEESDDEPDVGTGNLGANGRKRTRDEDDETERVTRTRR